MKLRTDTFNYISKDAGRTEFKVNIQVSKAHGFFFFNIEEIPAEIMALAPIATNGTGQSKRIETDDGIDYSRAEHVTRKDLGDLLGTIKSAITQYEDTSATRDEVKIIAYSMNLMGLMDRADLLESDRAACFEGGDKYIKDPSALELNFSWKILTQVTTLTRVRREDERVIYLDVEGDSYRIDDNEKVIEWTAEREAWFLSVEEALRGIMLKMDVFTKMSERQVERMIDSGQAQNILTYRGDQ